jgi:hypothetical protein
MDKKFLEVREKFGTKIIGPGKMQNLICKVVCRLPQKTADFVTRNVWFVNSFPDTWGFVLRGDELDGKFLVFLSNELFRQPRKIQEYEVFHEIGHVVLNHRNSITVPQSKEKIARQEREADTFARRYLIK